MIAQLNFPDLNFLAGWIGLTLGFITGFMLGFRFHDPEWKGGYASFERRMIRLAHISLFGLAIINLLFALTAEVRFAGPTANLRWASWLFVVGAVSMPLCCLAMARTVKSRALFVIPVFALTLGGALTAFELLALRAPIWK